MAYRPGQLEGNPRTPVTTIGDLVAASPAKASFIDELPAFDAPRLIGNSDVLANIRETATSIAQRKCTVLVLGETGTGKEMLARHIHAHSDRTAKPFVPVDCSALTDTLFESQLFGHLRGSFTGAVRDSLGFIRSADGGTLFLDEIGELSLPLQSKLLRVIQERAVVPVGDTKPRPVDVRIVCATHRDLRKMVADGQFREDLFFRLNVVSLHLPPLRERTGDIVPLAEHFLKLQADQYGEVPRPISTDAKLAMQDYAWPGNVRELANAMESAHVLSDGGEIRISDLPDRVKASAVIPTITGVVSAVSAGITSGFEAVEDLTLCTLERRALAEALRRTKGNKAAASRMLGLNIQRFNRMLSRLNVPA
jgi:transcriptional regulator with PAS, ATPase and Fis domain